VFLLVLSALGYPTYLIGRQVLAKGPTSLNCDTIHRSPQGALIGPFLDARYYFFLFTIIAPIIRAAFVGLARSDGFVQVIGLVTLELLYLLLLLFLRPGHTRRADVFDVTIAIIRLTCTAALLPFVKEKLDVDAIPRTGIGIGIAAVLSVGVIILSFNVLLHVIPWRWAWRSIRGPKKGEEGETLSRDESSEVEKGTAGVVLPSQEEPVPAANT
jgi:Transient receptor potential (TRP) ion channel